MEELKKLGHFLGKKLDFRVSTCLLRSRKLSEDAHKRHLEFACRERVKSQAKALCVPESVLHLCILDLD